MTTARLSTRISLRWPPEPAFENTDTLVLSVGNWYVDLRVDRASRTIDWAIAGERLQQESNEVLFTHELDSRNSFGVADCGTFSSLPNGDDLEVGVMPRTDLPGAPVREYEEVWRKLLFRRGEEGPSRGLSFILESPSGQPQTHLDESEEKEVVRTFIGAIWGTYVVLRQRQVLVRSAGGTKIDIKSGGEVSARREDFVQGVGYQVTYLLGSEAGRLPARKDVEFKKLNCRPGEKVVVSGEEYGIRAFEDLGGDEETYVELSTCEPVGVSAA